MFLCRRKPTLFSAISTFLGLVVSYEVLTAKDDVLYFPKVLFSKKDSRLAHADELFDAYLFTPAILAYKELLQDGIFDNLSELNEEEKNFMIQTRMQARFHLAYCYFIQESLLMDAVPLLQENIRIDQTLSVSLEEIRLNSLYLLAIIQKILGQYFEATETLKEYLSQKSPTELSFYEEASLEQGIVSFLRKQYDEATKHLESIEKVTIKPRLQVLSFFYLSRIHLVRAEYEEALKKLTQASNILSETDPLRFELEYLKGEVHFQSHHYLEAAKHFENALPQQFLEKCSWSAESLYRLGWSYLHVVDDTSLDVKEARLFLAKSEDSFMKLIEKKPDEKVYLALAQCYLCQATRLNEESGFEKAEALLRQNFFVSKEAQAQALLLRAAATPSFHLRDKFYRQLTQQENQGNPFFANSWFKRAKNDFDYGLFLLKSDSHEDASLNFERAANSFQKAYEFLKEENNSQASTALKYQALALNYSQKQNSDEQAFYLFDQLLKEHINQLQEMENPDEILYLHGFFAARLANKELKYLMAAEDSLKKVSTFTKSKFGDLSLFHLAAMYYQNEDFTQAESAYLELTSKFPTSSLAGEAWFWAARCSEKLKQEITIAQLRRRNVFENYPLSPSAPEAYFTLHTYQEYLQGERKVIKHLQNFIKKYPESPYLIEAYFLMGLDYKRDRKTAEGKWIRKRNLNEAIKAFQEEETFFDMAFKKGVIPEERLTYYVAINYRSILERALANLAIAEESQGAKRQIYLEYAEEVFKSLVDELCQKKFAHTKLLFEDQSYPSIQEESSYWLAQTYIKAENDQGAEKIFLEMLDKYQQHKITKGYYLSRIRYEQGTIARKKNDDNLALEFFQLSEDAAKGNVLNTDQRLDLWIQQSLCYRNLKLFDQAILILSRVINDDAISSLRLKAMYLRAETYELQGRPELGRKQLESLRKKGGVWAQKALEKLEKDYGY